MAKTVTRSPGGSKAGAGFTKKPPVMGKPGGPSVKPGTPGADFLGLKGTSGSKLPGFQKPGMGLGRKPGGKPMPARPVGGVKRRPVKPTA